MGESGGVCESVNVSVSESVRARCARACAHVYVLACAYHYGCVGDGGRGGSVDALSPSFLSLHNIPAPHPTPHAGSLGDLAILHTHTQRQAHPISSQAQGVGAGAGGGEQHHTSSGPFCRAAAAAGGAGVDHALLPPQQQQQQHVLLVQQQLQQLGAAVTGLDRKLGRVLERWVEKSGAPSYCCCSCSSRCYCSPGC